MSEEPGDVSGEAGEDFSPAQLVRIERMIAAAASRTSEHVDASVTRTDPSSGASGSQESTAVSSGEPKAHIFLGRNCLCLQPGLISLRLGLAVGAPGAGRARRAVSSTPKALQRHGGHGALGQANLLPTCTAQVLRDVIELAQLVFPCRLYGHASGVHTGWWGLTAVSCRAEVAHYVAHLDRDEEGGGYRRRLAGAPGI